MDREMKRHYTLLVDFLGKILGPDYEVALHELLDDSNEIIAIANGELTGRHLGSPLSNKMLEFLTSRLYETQDYVLRFESTSVTGKKLCSNSLFIKDPHGRLVGLLCINFDSSRYRELSARVMDLCGSLLTPGAPSGTHLIVENDELAIGGEVEVEFDAVAGFHSAAEGGKAIFRDAILGAVQTAVGVAPPHKGGHLLPGGGIRAEEQQKQQEQYSKDKQEDEEGFHREGPLFGWILREGLREGRWACPLCWFHYSAVRRRVQ